MFCQPGRAMCPPQSAQQDPHGSSDVIQQNFAIQTFAASGKIGRVGPWTRALVRRFDRAAIRRAKHVALFPRSSRKSKHVLLDGDSERVVGNPYVGITSRLLVIRPESMPSAEITSTSRLGKIQTLVASEKIPTMSASASSWNQRPIR